MLKNILGKLRLKSKEGFTLVELMVVVAIIGVLAAIAIPNYQKYQARARQSEAKVNLAALYTAHQAYYTEQGTFTGCVRQIGFDLNDNGGNKTKRYYTVGHTTVAISTCGPNGGILCTAYTFDATGGSILSCATGDGETYFSATAKVNGALTTGVATLHSGTLLVKDAFTAGAGGYISAATVTDQWTITQAKFLTNVVSGI